MGGKVCLRCKGKTFTGRCQQTFDINQQCFATLHQVNFPANEFEYSTDGEGVGIESRLSS